MSYCLPFKQRPELCGVCDTLIHFAGDSQPATPTMVLPNHCYYATWQRRNSSYMKFRRIRAVYLSFTYHLHTIKQIN